MASFRTIWIPPTVLGIALIGCDGTIKDGMGTVPTLQCLSPVKLVQPGAQTRFDWAFVGLAPTILTFGPDLDEDPAIYFMDNGTFDPGNSATEVLYTGPSAIPSARRLGIQAEATDGTTGSCTALLIPDIDASVALTAGHPGPFQNPLARAYSLASAPASMPDFSTLTASSVFPVNRIFKANNGNPFAGIAGLATNYAIQITGKLIVTRSGNHQFELLANTRANFWINGQQLSNNPGATALSAATALEPGEYPIRIDFYHAAGNSQLRLRWIEPGPLPITIVPPESLKY